MMDNRQIVTADIPSPNELPPDELPQKLVFRGIVNCARCRGNHGHVKGKAFTFPAGEFTHWGMCPTKWEPILFRAWGEVSQ